MSHPPKVAQDTSPALDTQTPGFVLPPHHEPPVAAYAHGPFITPDIVTPTEWKWRNVRTYVVTDKDGTDFRCIRVKVGRELVGYWAVELMGQTLFGDTVE